MPLRPATARLPVRRPLVGAALLSFPALVLGVRHPATTPVGCTIALGLALLAAILLPRHPRAGIPTALALVLAGYLHGSLADPSWSARDVNQWLQAPREYFEVVGTVCDDPSMDPPADPRDPGERWQYTLRLESAHRDARGWLAARGVLAVRATRPADAPDLRYGDRLRLAGVLERRLAGRADMRFTCLAGDEQGLVRAPDFRLMTSSFELRHAGRRALSVGLDDHPAERAFLHGLLWGYRRDIPYDVIDAFRQTGTLHILAISGAHVVIMGGLLLMVLRGLGAPVTTGRLIVVPFLFLYVLATGGSASAMRAAVMAAAASLGPGVGRRPDALSALALAALILTAVDATQVREAGFQLSFVAVLGLVVLMPGLPTLPRHLETPAAASLIPPSPASRLGRTLHLMLRTSAAAWLATTPLCAQWMNVVSTASLVGNLVVIPVSSLIMALGGLSMVAGLASESLSIGLNQLNAHLVAALLAFIHALSRVPFSYVHVVSPSHVALFGLYLLITAAVLGRGRLRRAALISALILASAAAVRYATDRRTTVNLGGPDAAPMIFINGPQAADVLVDPGPSWRAWNVCLALRRQGVDRLRAVWLTTLDAQHTGAAQDVITRFPTAELWYPSAARPPLAFQRLLDAARAGGVICRPLTPGTSVTAGPFLRLHLDALAGDSVRPGPAAVWSLTLGDARMALVTGGPGAPAAAGLRDVDLLALDTSLDPATARAALAASRPRHVVPRFHPDEMQEFADESVRSAALAAGSVWWDPGRTPAGVRWMMSGAPGTRPWMEPLVVEE